MKIKGVKKRKYGIYYKNKEYLLNTEDIDKIMGILCKYNCELFYKTKEGWQYIYSHGDIIDINNEDLEPFGIKLILIENKEIPFKEKINLYEKYKNYNIKDIIENAIEKEEISDK